MSEQVKSSAKTPEFEIPASVRDFAEKGVDQMKNTYAEIKTAAEDALDNFDKSTTAWKDGTVKYNQRAIEFTQTNLNANFTLASKLVAAKDINEFVALQSEFARSQAKAMGEQAKELAELQQTVVEQSSKPIKDGVEKSVEKTVSKVKAAS